MCRYLIADGSLIAMYTLHHRLWIALGGWPHLCATSALGNVVEYHQAITSTWMRCVQGILSQPLWALLQMTVIDLESNRSILSGWSSTIGELTFSKTPGLKMDEVYGGGCSVCTVFAIGSGDSAHTGWTIYLAFLAVRGFSGICGAIDIAAMPYV